MREKMNRNKKKEKFIACTPKNKKFEIVNPLDTRVKIKGKRYDFKIVEDEKGFSYIVYKNKKYHVEILEKNQNKYIVMVNGVWHSFSIETPISFKRRKTLSKNGSVSKVENVMAPMPGKVVDVMVEENGEIKEGEPILILEAMKMQNEIVSNVNGTIKKINIKNNDSVMKDEVMIEIEKA
ncbi:MAG: acetyl-CoA carboxylase biotin carboxyl carrier protein subunit [Bacteroidota bacterium]